MAGSMRAQSTCKAVERPTVRLPRMKSRCKPRDGRVLLALEQARHGGRALGLQRVAEPVELGVAVLEPEPDALAVERLERGFPVRAMDR